MDLRVRHGASCPCGCNFRGFLAVEPETKKNVTVISGESGAGEMAVMNRMLSPAGQTQMDAVLIRSGIAPVTDVPEWERIHVFNDTSLFVDRQTLLNRYLAKLYSRSFDRLLLEIDKTVGAEQLSDLLYRPPARDCYELSSFIAVIDAVPGLADLEQSGPMLEQAMLADHVVVKETDTATEAELNALVSRLRQINPLAVIHTADSANVEELLEADVYTQVSRAAWNQAEAGADGCRPVILRVEEPLDMKKVNDWIRQLYNLWGDKILRGKGYFNIAGSDYRFDFQSLRKTFHSKTECEWEDTRRESVVVFVGEGLPAGAVLLSGLKTCIASN